MDGLDLSNQLRTNVEAFLRLQQHVDNTMLI